MRILWDIYESALLLDAYIRVLHGVNRQAEIKMLSDALRQMALNKGIEIDDVYRNANGVSLQMSNLEYAYTGGESGVRCKTKIFYEIVDLYRSDKSKYEETLLLAKKLVSGGSANNVPSTSDVDGLASLAKSRGVKYIDKRSVGGCFWIIGSIELLKFVYDCKSQGVIFHRKFSGSKATKGRPGWWTKDSLIHDEENSLGSPQRDDIVNCFAEHFSYGMPVDSMIELMRFRQYFEEDYGRECDASDEGLAEIFRESLFVFNGKYYLISGETVSDVKSMIESAFSNGSRIMYFQNLYDSRRQKLLSENILSSEMLRALTEIEMPEYAVKKRYILALGCSESESECVKNEILRVWNDFAIRKVDDLESLLPMIPQEVINNVLATRPEFVKDSPGKYCLASSFCCSEDDLATILSEYENQRDSEESKSLMEIALATLRPFNAEISESAFIELLLRRLPNGYSKRGRSIARDAHLSTSEVCFNLIADYCSSHDACSFDELNELVYKATREVHYPIVVEAANSVMVRINKDQFVADSSVSFDIDATDEYLGLIVSNNVMGMKEIVSLASFPACGYPWNHFVLESYCWRFSDKFRYMTHTPNSDNCGAIVKDPFDGDYHDVMAMCLARSNVQLTQEKVFDYLLDSGLLVRRRYGRIKDLIKLADSMRKNGN